MNATITERRRHAKRLGVLALLALVLSAFSVQSIGAKPASKIITTYYKEASKQQVVGERTLFCGGSVMMMGEKTAYSSSYRESCSPHVRP